MAQFETLGTVFVIHSNYGCIFIVLEIKRYISRKSRFFAHPLAFDAFVRGRGVPNGILTYRLVRKN